FPVGDVRPLRVLVERLERPVERVGVVQGAAADTGTGQDEAVAQQVDPLYAVAAQLRSPQEVPQIPGGLGEFVIGKPPSRLEHRDAVSLFGQPERSNTAAKSGTDNDDVEIGVALLPFSHERQVKRNYS